MMECPRLTLVLLSLAILTGCATAKYQERANPEVQQYVERLGRQILIVTEKASEADQYQFKLAELQQQGIVGVSVGGRVIYIDYELARKSYEAIRGQAGTPIELATVSCMLRSQPDKRNKNNDRSIPFWRYFASRDRRLLLPTLAVI